MGRMLEALERTEDASPLLAPATNLIETPELEAPEEEMPFVEVGGARKPSESKPRLDVPALQSPSLQVWAPQGVALKSGAQPTARTARIAAELIAFHQPDHPVSQQYAALFAQLNTEPTDAGGPALVFTALSAGAGTTTAVLNLAVAGCIKHGKSIVVVDANLARPALPARLGVTAAVGLCNVVEGQAALEQAVQATSLKGLQVLSAGRAGVDRNLSSDAFRWVLAWLRQRYDVVLIDGPAWTAFDDLRGLLPAASAVYVVLDANEAEKPEVRSLTREVARQGSRLGGMIVTR